MRFYSNQFFNMWSSGRRYLLSQLIGVGGGQQTYVATGELSSLTLLSTAALTSDRLFSLIYLLTRFNSLC